MAGNLDIRRLGEKAFWPLFGFLTLIALVPLWSFRVPPMQDIWQHLALVDVMHNYDAPGSIYPYYFFLPEAPRPNLVYYFVTHWLAYLFELETANKIVLSGYIVSFAPAFLYLLRSFGRPRWLVFFAFPFIYNAMFGYGFVSFLLAMPILFVAIGAYRRFVEPRGCELDLRLGGLVAGLMVLAFFTHAHTYMLICFLAGILLLLHREGGWGFVLRAAPFVPALAFFVPWFIVYFIEGTPSSSGMSFGSFDQLFGPTYYRPSIIVNSFFHYIGDYFNDERETFLFLIIVLVMAVFLIVRRAPEVEPGSRRKLARFDLEILTLVLASSVLFLPQHIEAQSIVSLRHVIFALLFFIGWLGWENAPRRLIVPAIAVLLVIDVLSVANLMRGFSKFEDELDDYPALFENVEPGKRLLKVAYSQESKVVNYGALWHIHFFYTIRKGGISDLQFAEYPHNPIQYRSGMVPPTTPVDFFKSPAWRYYDYVLLRRSSMPPLKAVEDVLEKVADNAGWILYKVIEGPLPRGYDEVVVSKPRRTHVRPEGESDDPGVPRIDSSASHRARAVMDSVLGRRPPLPASIGRRNDLNRAVVRPPVLGH